MYSMLASMTPDTLVYCFVIGAVIGIIGRIIKNQDDGYS
jgi:hypothetical protein